MPNTIESERIYKMKWKCRKQNEKLSKVSKLLILIVCEVALIFQTFFARSNFGSISSHLAILSAKVNYCRVALTSKRHRSKAEESVESKKWRKVLQELVSSERDPHHFQLLIEVEVEGEKK